MHLKVCDHCAENCTLNAATGPWVFCRASRLFYRISSVTLLKADQFARRCSTIFTAISCWLARSRACARTAWHSISTDSATMHFFATRPEVVVGSFLLGSIEIAAISSSASGGFSIDILKNWGAKYSRISLICPKFLRNQAKMFLFSTILIYRFHKEWPTQSSL